MSYFSNYGNFCVHKVSKIVNLLSLDRFFQPHNTPKFVFFWPGLQPGPRWGSLRLSPRPPSRLRRGTLPPHYPLPSTSSASRSSAHSAPRCSTPSASRSGLSRLQPPPPSISVLEPGLERTSLLGCCIKCV